MDILTCDCGSGTGNAFDGIVQTYADLPVDNTAALGAVYLVRQSTGVWLISRKQAGLYQRVDTTGTRATDWQYLGDWLEEFSDANFSVYNDADNSKSFGFDVTGVSIGTRRILSVPDKSGTLALEPSAQTRNTFYGGPTSGSDALPAFRAIEEADLPPEAIVDTGSYANPSWLTELEWSKITFTPNSLSGYGILDAQPLNADLTAIAGLSGTGYAKRTGTGAWALAATIAWTVISGAPTTLSGYGITDAQPLDSDLSAIAALTTTTFGRSLLTESDAAALKTTLSLDAVENTSLSTWAGSANVTTLGTIGTGTWSATAIAATKGGTGLSSYTLGDVLYSSASNTLSKLSGNATSTKKFFTQTGTGSVSAAPSWATIAAGDIPDISATYAKSGLATGSGLTMNTSRILGRTTASSGVIEELTVGTSMSLSATVLNTIQDIRTTDSPTFAGLTVNGDVAIGLSSTGVTVLEINGATGSGNGAYLAFDRNGLPKNYIGSSSALHSNNTEDMDLVSSGNINIYPNSSSVLGSFSASGLTVDRGSGSLPAAFPTASNYGLRVLAEDGVTSRAIFGSFGGANSITGASFGGTRASPTATTSDTRALVIQIDTYDGTSSYVPANFDIRADGLQSTSNHGGYFLWAGIPNGSSTTTATEWMRLQSANLQLGSSSAATAIRQTWLNTDGSAYAEIGTDGRFRLGNAGTSGTPDLVIGHLGGSGGGIIIFAVNNTEVGRFNSSTLVVGSGKDLQLGRAYSAGVVAATGTIAIKDSTGTTYNVLVHT